MTTIAISQAAPARTYPRRILRVARVLLTNTPALTGWPLIVLTVAFAINLALFYVLRNVPVEKGTGGQLSIYIVQLVVCWQLLHQYFSFVVGLNVTRRAYYSGVLALTLAQSVVLGLLMFACAAVERATGGWGLDMAFFDPTGIMDLPAPQAALVYVVPMILVSCLGYFGGAITKRWAGWGIFLVMVANVLVVSGLAVLATALDAWTQVRTWFADNVLAIFTGWLLVPAALAAGAAWLVMRRTVP